MAVTRSFLKGMGLTDEQISAIVEEHANTVAGLKEARDGYKAEAERLQKVQQELDELKSTNSDAWKAKYDGLKKSFEDFKVETANKARLEKVRSAYAALLREANVDTKRIDAILKVTDFSEMETDEKGQLEKSQALLDGIKEEWGAFIQTTGVQPAKVDTPPESKAAGMTREEIYAKDESGRYKLSTSERQKALIDHPDLLR